MEYIDVKVNKGTKGIFNDIERSANKLCAMGLMLLAAVTTILVTIASFVDHSAYMVEVRICAAILVIDCLVMMYITFKTNVHQTKLKYILFLAWSLALGLMMTSVDSSVTILYAIPVLLATRYYDVVFTIVVSVLNIIFAFIPYIINVYKRAFPLDFVVLEQGTVITMAGDSLDGTVNALESINITDTISNMLAYGYLTLALILVMISILAVALTKLNHDNLIKQYNISRNRIEK